ncbi:hypothetical protein CYMTET_35206 [Cymbomonas tetramitiformis]|uniref:Uncharacterized protein n=1 Tax=Cymbomonas tetramitiformis TaxID=36881 RepID=A0AAE0F9I9_9CHLO|nr:hypothetical protein CYMTET_35206 [Cymbomonas tetramitiformis]
MFDRDSIRILKEREDGKMEPIPVMHVSGSLVVYFWSSHAVFAAVDSRIKQGALSVNLHGKPYPVGECELVHERATFIEVETTAAGWEEITRRVEGRNGELMDALRTPGAHKISDSATSLLIIPPELDAGWLPVSASPTTEERKRHPTASTPTQEDGADVSPAQMQLGGQAFQAADVSNVKAEVDDAVQSTEPHNQKGKRKFDDAVQSTEPHDQKGKRKFEDAGKRKFEERCAVTEPHDQKGKQKLEDAVQSTEPHDQKGKRKLEGAVQSTVRTYDRNDDSPIREGAIAEQGLPGVNIGDAGVAALAEAHGVWCEADWEGTRVA